MSDVTPLKRNIQVEESRFKFAVSESMIQKTAGSINFINYYQHSEKQFFANGKYNLAGFPQTTVDGFTFFQYNAEIIDAWMYIQTAGSSGTTELDVKYASTPGGAFTSIFSTTPKISYAAGDNVWIHVGSALANTTAPVLSTTNVDAGWALKFDIVQGQSGSAIGTGIVLHYKPR